MVSIICSDRQNFRKLREYNPDNNSEYDSFVSDKTIIIISDDEKKPQKKIKIENS